MCLQLVGDPGVDQEHTGGGPGLGDFSHPGNPEVVCIVVLLMAYN